MRATDIIAMQLLGSCDLIADNALASSAEWTGRAFESASRPGFILWHAARIVDWGVNAVVRCEPELAAASAWNERIRYDLGHGAGLTQTQADEAAQTVSARDVAEYAVALKAAIDEWLREVGDTDLGRVVDVRAACMTHPHYQTPAAWAEVENLDQRPAWQFITRPCVAHIRTHMGELATLRAALRTAAGS